ncbi:hypothetical protein [Sandarakinorhabdus sp.]|uniref:hypothetical protein n=1 Tax=Sandarakinorhabdus sp. TaxID=1916663 RepID=UPI00286D93E9|nr:hypothetical protein [Sandarakinorhabdus sp.]
MKHSHVLLLALLITTKAAAQQAAAPTPTGAEQIVTPDKGETDDALERAATKPLRDLNIMATKTAPELAAIMARPYALEGLRTCRQLNAEVNWITTLVGPDVDDPALASKRGRDPAEQLLDGAESITGNLILGQGLIREITGASKSARKAAGARLAGQLRRSYIKGVMFNRGCRLVPPPPTKP